MAKEVNQPVEIAYSGGKDSDVILELAKMAGINYRAIYKNTTIDPPYTIKHCKSKGVEIMQPKMTFFELVRKRGIPTRRARFCCEVLKEYKILDYVVLGIRRTESSARAKRYLEPEKCRVYNKHEKCRQYFPILEWTDDDVVEFVKVRNITCHPLYYDASTPPNSLLHKDLGALVAHWQATTGLEISSNTQKWQRPLSVRHKRGGKLTPICQVKKNFPTCMSCFTTTCFATPTATLSTASNPTFGAIRLIAKSI